MWGFRVLWNCVYEDPSTILIFYQFLFPYSCLRSQQGSDCLIFFIRAVHCLICFITLTWFWIPRFLNHASPTVIWNGTLFWTFYLGPFVHTNRVRARSFKFSPFCFQDLRCVLLEIRPGFWLDSVRTRAFLNCPEKVELHAFFDIPNRVYHLGLNRSNRYASGSHTFRHLEAVHMSSVNDKEWKDRIFPKGHDSVHSEISLSSN